MESTIQEHQYLEQKKKIDKFQNDYNISEFNVFKIYFVDVNHLSAMDKRSLFYMEYIYIKQKTIYPICGNFGAAENKRDIYQQHLRVIRISHFILLNR